MNLNTPRLLVTVGEPCLGFLDIYIWNVKWCVVIDKFLQEALSHSMRVTCFTVWATPVMFGELIARVVVIFKHPIEAWTQWIINSGCYKSRDLKPDGKREGDV